MIITKMREKKIIEDRKIGSNGKIVGNKRDDFVIHL